MSVHSPAARPRINRGSAAAATSKAPSGLVLLPACRWGAECGRGCAQLLLPPPSPPKLLLLLLLQGARLYCCRCLLASSRFRSSSAQAGKGSAQAASERNAAKLGVAQLLQHG